MNFFGKKASGKKGAGSTKQLRKKGGQGANNKAQPRGHWLIADRFEDRFFLLGPENLFRSLAVIRPHHALSRLRPG